jgi:hypothetical protein
MAYLDCTHFSDKFSYKIFFIPSYRFKDMNFASFKHLQQFSEKQIRHGTFLTELFLARVTDQLGRRADWALTMQETLRWHWLELTGGGHLSESENASKKGWPLCRDSDLNQRSTRSGKGTD